MLFANEYKSNIAISSNAVFTGLTDKLIPAYIAIINNKIAAIGSEILTMVG